MSSSDDDPQQPQTSPGTAKPPTLGFDQDGDLYLSVGSGDTAQDMLVDSRALCRSSPVFRKMLTGGFKESKPDSGEWRVNLPEDEPRIFSILMDMCHCQYDQTPKKPSVSKLHLITKMTDKYDMLQMLRPVAQSWLNVLREKDALEAPPLAVIFIAVKFGLKQVLLKTARKLSESLSIQADGKYVCGSGAADTPGEDDPIVNLDYLKKHRQNMLAIIHKEFRGTFDRLVQGVEPCLVKENFRHNKGKSSPFPPLISNRCFSNTLPSTRCSCYDTLLGKLLIETGKAQISGLFDSLETNSYTTKSIIDIKATLLDVKATFPHQADKDILDRLHRTVCEETGKEQLPGTVYQVQQMEKQRQKTKSW